MVTVKNGRLQCKDIADKDFLLGILYVRWKKWGNRYSACSSTWDVQRYLADDLDDIRPWIEGVPTWGQDNRPFNCDFDELNEIMPYKLVVAKANSLIRRNLIDGCGCGCRGDFEVLPRGYELLVS